MTRLCWMLSAALLATLVSGSAWAKKDIVHDAEYYNLKAQHGDKWATQDEAIEAKLKALQEKHGTPPNIIHIMWDDSPVGEMGIPHLQKNRGFATPNINQFTAEGAYCTRMYTEPSCTPSRAAFMTGRHAVRTGMYNVSFPMEYGGLSEDETTLGEVMSKAGYATAFYGKGHLGDIEESYMTNMGFDEAFWALYNQVTSLYNNIGEGANAIIGLKKELLADNPYHLDETFIQGDAFVFYLEGKKGEQAMEWRNGSQELQDYKDFDIEGRERALDFIRRSAEAEKPFFVSWWPLWISFIANPEKNTLQRGMVGEDYQRIIEPDIAALRATLEELGIAENTLIIAMADNGPITPLPAPGLARECSAAEKVISPRVVCEFLLQRCGRVSSSRDRSSAI